MKERLKIIAEIFGYLALPIATIAFLAVCISICKSEKLRREVLLRPDEFLPPDNGQHAEN